MTDQPWFLPLLGVLLLVNIAGWAMMRADKMAARAGRRRTPERTLLLVALFGGSLGVLYGIYGAGSQGRHKTGKTSFLMPAWLILVGQIILLAVAWWVLRPV